MSLGHARFTGLASRKAGLLEHRCAMTDVSARVRPLVDGLRPLAQKLAEVEASLGRRAGFNSDPGLVGYAAARVEKPEGKIYLRPDSVEDVSVIGEEIMHLHRMARAYPVIKPLQRSCDDGYNDALNGLTGFFEEHASFPFLEDIGLDPRRAVGQAIGDSLRMLPQALTRIAEWPEPMRTVKLSALFVQTNLMASPSAARDGLLMAFQAPPLYAAGQIGTFLCDEIAAAGHDAPREVEVRMQRCIERLGIPGDAAIVSVERFRRD